jgi:hypothetical protein
MSEKVKRVSKPRPIIGESETGFYRYNGTPISIKDQKEYYEPLGVVFKVDEGGDLMPDGVHLKPRRLRNDRFGQRDAKLHLVKAGTQSVIAKWEALPEPKPPFTEWYVQHNEADLASALVDIARNPTESPQARIKAISLLWEFTKSKPKAQLEVSQPVQPMTNMTAQELLALACELNGITLQEVMPQQSGKKSLN